MAYPVPVPWGRQDVNYSIMFTLRTRLKSFWGTIILPHQNCWLLRRPLEPGARGGIAPPPYPKYRPWYHVIGSQVMWFHVKLIFWIIDGQRGRRCRRCRRSAVSSSHSPSMLSQRVLLVYYYYYTPWLEISSLKYETNQKCEDFEKIITILYLIYHTILIMNLRSRWVQ